MTNAKHSINIGYGWLWRNYRNTLVKQIVYNFKLYY